MLNKEEGEKKHKIKIKNWHLLRQQKQWMMQTWPTTNHSIISWFTKTGTIHTKFICQLIEIAMSIQFNFEACQLFALRIQFCSSDWRLNIVWPFFVDIWSANPLECMYAICIDWKLRRNYIEEWNFSHSKFIVGEKTRDRQS